MEQSDRRGAPASEETREVPYHGLWTRPFRENSDPSFLWLGPQYREAFAALRAAVLQNVGLLVLTGDVGTGKTMLARALADSLRAEVQVGRLAYAGLQPGEFWNAVTHELGLPGVADTHAGVPASIGELLRGAYVRREKILLVIDEAQDLASGVLDEIGQLAGAGLEAGLGKVNVINILLVGQPAIVARLGPCGPRGERPIVARLGPLPAEQVAEYIAFRLRVAGADRDLFSTAAVAEIAVAAAGVPRLISRICDYALHVASQRNEAVVSADVVTEALCDFGLSAPGGATRLHRLGSRVGKRIAYAAALALAVGLGAMAYRGGASNIHGHQERDDPASASETLGESRFSPAVASTPVSIPAATGGSPGEPSSAPRSVPGEASSAPPPPDGARRGEAAAGAPPEAGGAGVSTASTTPIPEARAGRLEPEPSTSATPRTNTAKVRPPSAAPSRRANRSPGPAPAATAPGRPDASGTEEPHDPGAIINWLLQGNRPGTDR